MATVGVTDNVYKSLSHLAFTWTPLTTTNADGAGVDYGPGAGGRTVQIEGTFGVGGNVTIEGTNDPDPTSATWFTLNDLGGSALGTITAAGIHSIREEPLYIRPRVTVGDGTTSITAILVVRKNNLG